MTKDQAETLFSCYLGIRVLQTMLRAAGQDLGAQRAASLIEELEKAFPFLVTKHARLTLNANAKPQQGEAKSPS